jgi:hypothetical protein
VSKLLTGMFTVLTLLFASGSAMAQLPRTGETVRTRDLDRAASAVRSAYARSIQADRAHRYADHIYRGERSDRAGSVLYGANTRRWGQPAVPLRALIHARADARQTAQQTSNQFNAAMRNYSRLNRMASPRVRERARQLTAAQRTPSPAGASPISAAATQR